MNHEFSPNNLQQQHQLLHQTSPPAAGALSYLQQHQQHLAAAAAAGSTATHTSSALFDPRNTILIANNFPHHQALSTTLPSAQPLQTPLHTAYNNSNNNTNNIRIVSTAASALQPAGHHVFSINNGNDSASQLVTKETQSMQLSDPFTPLFHHAQNHSIHNNHSQQAQPQAQVQVQHQHFTAVAAAQHHLQQHQHQLSTLLPQHYAAQQQHYATQGAHGLHTLQLTGATTPATYYVPSETAVADGSTSSTSNMIAGIAAAASSVPQAQPSSTTVTPTASQSTVVLDRINICINNHYTDSMSSSGGAPAMTGSSAGSTPTSMPQQPSSPIIPAIQHKAAVIDASLLLLDAYTSNDDSTMLVIDEPDSTTTTTSPHTPPTTPANCSPITVSLPGEAALQAAVDTERQPQSPSSTCGMDARIVELVDSATSPAKSDGVVIVTDETKKPAVVENHATDALLVVEKTEKVHAASQLQQAPALVVEQMSPMISPTMPTPPSSAESSPPEPPTPAYANGEDVFIKRQDDGRFYLGTIIDIAGHQFLVRFDDKSELWCGADEMRKLSAGVAGDGPSNSSVGGASAAMGHTGPMCVACKRAQRNDVVEICERCGRGYHRNCTTETAPGSGVWFCKRCVKPMKIKPSASDYKAYGVCRQLPYHVDALTWDDKHRVNEEQIYCYCGKTGKFDDNMLQCCKCRNWFHTRCLHCEHARNLTRAMLRGDGFFVFACSVCNEGAEFARRLQINWVDLLHLALYNLSALKKHQHQKYHHLLKDIWPFVRERRRQLPIAHEWLEMSDALFLDHIKRTLREHTDRFISGREIKRDHYYYGLRNNGPPLLPAIQVHVAEPLNDSLLTKKLKLALLRRGASRNSCVKPRKENAISKDVSSTPVRKGSVSSGAREERTTSTNDVYEFRIEDDEKFTSDDEIPIKHIMEKVKKGATPTTSNLTIIQLSPAKVKDKALKCSTSPHTTPKKCSPLKEKKYSPKKASGCNGGGGGTPPKLCAVPSTKLPAADADGDDVKVETISAQAAPTNSAVTSAAPVTPRSRKRKTFTLSKSYREIAKRNICYSSSDENSSTSSRCNSLDLMIPPSKDFLGSNNPFRIVSPKKSEQQLAQRANGYKRGSLVGGSAGGGQRIIQNSIINATSRLDLNSKLAALKSTGIFANLSTSNLAKAAGQPRTVRTIKRRLSAKDITIGPNQEVRRRRTRRQTSNVEVISTTTINTIPSNFFPLHAKDIHVHMSGTCMQHNNNKFPCTVHSSSSASSSPPGSTCSSAELRAEATARVHPPPPPPPPPPLSLRPTTATHGRLLRQRPQKPASPPPNSRRNSLASFAGCGLKSGAASLTVPVATTSTALRSLQSSGTASNDDAALQKNVQRYFGVPNRFESGEPYRLLARRWLPNGQLQYLVEWGVPQDYRSEPECEESSNESDDDSDAGKENETKEIKEPDSAEKENEPREKEINSLEIKDKHETIKQENNHNKTSELKATSEKKENSAKNEDIDNNHSVVPIATEAAFGKTEQSEKEINEKESAVQR